MILEYIPTYHILRLIWFFVCSINSIFFDYFKIFSCLTWCFRGRIVRLIIIFLRTFFIFLIYSTTIRIFVICIFIFLIFIVIWFLIIGVFSFLLFKGFTWKLIKMFRLRISEIRIIDYFCRIFQITQYFEIITCISIVIYWHKGF